MWGLLNTVIKTGLIAMQVTRPRRRGKEEKER